jgi:hypothetical protein
LPIFYSAFSKNLDALFDPPRSGQLAFWAFLFLTQARSLGFLPYLVALTKHLRLQNLKTVPSALTYIMPRPGYTGAPQKLHL